MLKIVKYPDEILTKKNEIVSFPLSGDIKRLINEMWQTVKDKGVGLAAPQVGANYKLCIIHMSEDNSNKANQDFVMINPEITFYSQAEALMVEGCLSFPNQYYEIWRPQGIRVKFQDEKGRWKEKTFSGWMARVVQHEVDHLNGELFINKGGRKIEEDQVDKDKVVD
ncbi:MAG: peptide deformylase [Patescibacteria group bacterium]